MTDVHIELVGPVGRFALAAAKRAETAANDPNVVAVGEDLLLGVAGKLAIVAGIAPQVEDVADIAEAVSEVAAIAGHITTLAPIAGQVTTVAGISGAVTDVAANQGNINLCATNMAAITAAPGHATTAATQAGISITKAGEAVNAAAAAATAQNNAIAMTTNAPSYKVPVRLIARTDVPLVHASPPIADGVQTVIGDRIGLVVQNNSAENGIYIVGVLGLTRATDADSAEKVANMEFRANEGVRNRGRVVRLRALAAIVLGTTPLYFTVTAFGDRGVTPLRPTIVIVGNSNRNGRIDYYTNLPLELTGPGRPLEGAIVYNMAQNGSQLSGWRTATQTSPRNRVPQDYTGLTSPTDLYQVCAANPSRIVFSLGINDFNNPANRAGPGAAFGENLDWAVNFMLMNSDADIDLEVPQPFTMPDFVVGGFTTDWGGDAGALSPADNCAKWSQILRGHYLAQMGRDPRVKVHDTAEIFNPGVTGNPALHRCDDVKRYCLDPDAAHCRFQASITGDVMTVTKMYGSGTIQAGRPIAPAGSGTGADRLVQAFGTDGTTGTGGVGTYKLSAGADVANSAMKQPASLLDDSLHFSTVAARRILESYAHHIGMTFRRRISSLIGSDQGVPPYDDIFQKGFFSCTFRMNGRSQSGANMLVDVFPSPEAVFLAGDPSGRRGGSRNASWARLLDAERAMMRENLGLIRYLSNFRGRKIKLFVRGGTGTIYTATGVAFSSVVTGISYYHSIQFFGVNFMAEPATGDLIVWVEDPADIPFGEHRKVMIAHNGTAGIANNPYASSQWEPTTLIAHRALSPGTAFTKTLRLHNQTDGRFVEGSVNFGTAAGMPVAEWSFGTNVMRAATATINTTNRDAAIAAGIWPADTANFVLKNGYWLSLGFSLSTGPGEAMIRY